MDTHHKADRELAPPSHLISALARMRNPAGTTRATMYARIRSCLSAISEDVLHITPAVKNRNDLQWIRFGAVYD
jgi:hypothetical protein